MQHDGLGVFYTTQDKSGCLIAYKMYAWWLFPRSLDMKMETTPDPQPISITRVGLQSTNC